MVSGPNGCVDEVGRMKDDVRWLMFDGRRKKFDVRAIE